MKITKQPQHHELETSWYQRSYNAIKQFLAQGELTEFLDNELDIYDLKTSYPISERNTQNACLVLIFWILYMHYEYVQKWYQKDYFAFFEECYDISEHNNKLKTLPHDTREAQAMTKENEKESIDYITNFMYEVDVKMFDWSKHKTSIAPVLKNIIDGHSLLEIYKGLTKYANDISESLYKNIYNPSDKFLIALGKEANCGICYPQNGAFTKILACKPKWQEMIVSMSDDKKHLRMLGILVWNRRFAYQYDYLEEIAIHYWIHVCNVEEMHQLDDEFGYVAEKKEEKKTIISQQYKKKFIQAKPIWEEFVKKGYLESEGEVYRWLGNHSQFGYFIHYAHKHLHKPGTKEEDIDWKNCCKLFTMPLTGTGSYRNACSTIKTFEENKRNKSKKCEKPPLAAIEINKIFKYAKRPNSLK